MSLYSSEADVITEGVRYLKVSLPCFFLFMALRVDHIMKIVICLPRLISGKWMKKIKVK